MGDKIDYELVEMLLKNFDYMRHVMSKHDDQELDKLQYKLYSERRLVDYNRLIMLYDKIKSRLNLSRLNFEEYEISSSSSESNFFSPPRYNN